MRSFLLHVHSKENGMSIFVYALTMVNTPPNKRWHLEGTPYYRVRVYEDGSEQAENASRSPYHFYDLRDGWGIGVYVYETSDPVHIARVCSSSRGFLCYDWMVSSIEQHGIVRQVLPTFPKRRTHEVRTEVL